MYYLIYVSSATRLMRDEELLHLLEKSRANNSELSITGMLLYKGGNFMQMLEGDRDTVKKLYDTIKRDTRHKDVTTITTDSIKKRSFENWSMGFCNMDKLGDLPRYKDYLKQTLNPDAFQEDSQSAYQLMMSFDETNR